MTPTGRVSTEEQRAKWREYRRRYRETHREELNAKHRAQRLAHPEEEREYSRTYREAHRDQIRAYDIAHRDQIRARQRTLRYGTSAEWAEEMLDAQEGQCAICPAEIGIDARVDHDHTTGIARALLCHRCNIRLGAVEDAEFLASALSYLEVHAA